MIHLPPPEELCLVPLEAEDRETLLRVMARRLRSYEYVTEEFADAVVAREEEFPTGLPTSGHYVAIPHADARYCVKPGIAVAVLPHPIDFREMGAVDSILPVRVVFMLSVPEADKQVTVLQQLIELVQDPSLLETLASTYHPGNVRAVLERAVTAG